MNLQTLRSKIDRLDKEIIGLLNSRAALAKEVACAKRREGKSVYSPDRESQVLKLAGAVNKGPLSTQAVLSIYREIMSASLGLGQPLRIAYLGPQASFSNLAAIKKFGQQVAYLPCQSIATVFTEVETDHADYGVVPIENSIEGAISYTLDMFVESELKICSQVTLDISHNLLASCAKDKIKRIYSIPQVFGQCRIWLQENMPGVEKIDVSSTTRGAEIAHQQKNAGCIASLLAARVYKLKVLERGIEDSPHNITRFLVIGKTDAGPTGHDKTSILFSIKDKVGALYEMLLPFKKHNLNLTKIESRPSKRKAWDYYFYVDLEGHIHDHKVKQALAELENRCKFLKVLGSYPVSEKEI